MRAVARRIQLNTLLEDLSLDGGSIAIDIALDFGTRIAREHIHQEAETTIFETYR